MLFVRPFEKMKIWDSLLKNEYELQGSTALKQELGLSECGTLYQSYAHEVGSASTSMPLVVRVLQKTNKQNMLNFFVTMYLAIFSLLFILWLQLPTI